MTGRDSKPLQMRKAETPETDKRRIADQAQELNPLAVARSTITCSGTRALSADDERLAMMLRQIALGYAGGDGTLAPSASAPLHGIESHAHG